MLFIIHAVAFDQFFKLPVLVMHYIEHRAADKNLTVIEYLSMHYWGDDKNDNDYDRDMQLPFKKIDHHSIQQVFLPLARVLTLRSQVLVPTIIQYPLFRDKYLPEPATASLFRPPRA